MPSSGLSRLIERRGQQHLGTPRDAILDHNMRPLVREHVDDHGGWSYTTVLTSTAVPLDVEGNVDNFELRWVPVNQVEALPLLPAFRASWPLVLQCALSVLTG